MKSFTFTLERTRRYKEQVLKKEKGQMQRVLQQRNEIERQIRELEAYREQKARELQGESQKGLSPARLAAYRFYLENTRLQLIPVVLFSSLINEEMQRKGQELGADEQISKPQIAQLVSIIDRLTA